MDKKITVEDVSEYGKWRDEFVAEAKPTGYKSRRQLLKAFHLAWELGHANGKDDISAHFWDIVAVIRAK